MKAIVDTPIFIHSLFRSGSTYIFNVFHHSDENYWCYQEPLNEYLIHAATEPDKLLEVDKAKQKFLRHPELDKPYFYEFHNIAKKVGKLFCKEFSYDQYFTTTKDDFIKLKTYFTALQEGAQGRAVFQCCRSAGRVSGLKTECGGTHIFLWRNPWDQWWSYKKDLYFDMSNLLICNAKNLPVFLKELKEELKIPNFHNKSTLVEYDYYESRRLDSTGSYKLFYALWCHAMLEAKPYCDLSINIDQLSVSHTYRNEVLQTLQNTGISGLDFSDCSMPIASYGESDGNFFLKVEDDVHELLLSHGYSQLHVDELKILSDERKKRLVDVNAPENSAIRDAMHTREYMQRAEEVFKVTLTEQQAHSQWLQKEWDYTKAVLTKQLTDSQQLQDDLDNTKAALSKQQADSQRLQDDWNYTKAVLDKQQAHSQWLENEWDYTKSVLTEQHVYSQGLQNELYTANLKIDELNHTKHQWWAAADRLTQELQSVYSSKSWRITWPLRKLLSFFKWLISLPNRFLFWAVRFPKRA
ncbi:MAG: hypothetical protein IME94_11445, partial [Proteobacteria bacterium]|nr:hypothetical protein [Pseudomonadota bacterium]